MAYGSNAGQGQGSNNGAAKGQGSYGARPAAQSTGTGGEAGKKPFEKDPNEVGIAYLKTSDKIGTYFSVSITQDIPAGAKLVIFENKTKNKSDKTPTHVLKLSTMTKKN